MRAMTRPMKGRETGPVLWASRDDAEHEVAYWRSRPVEARTELGRFLPGVSDPPPMEVEHDGQRFYLARLNAYRATYSNRPPPREP
jgi:hypothetical protein